LFSATTKFDIHSKLERPSVDVWMLSEQKPARCIRLCGQVLMNRAATCESLRKKKDRQQQGWRAFGWSWVGESANFLGQN